MGAGTGPRAPLILILCSSEPPGPTWGRADLTWIRKGGSAAPPRGTGWRWEMALEPTRGRPGESRWGVEVLMREASRTSSWGVIMADTHRSTPVPVRGHGETAQRDWSPA